jgi:hypothetical protein
MFTEATATFSTAGRVSAVTPAVKTPEIGGSVGTGAKAGNGVRVGHGVAVGWGVGVGEADVVPVLANAVAASRRATRSQATTKLIRLRAMTVALKPSPILRGCGFLVVIVLAFVVIVIFVAIVFVVIIVVIIIVVMIVMVFVLPAITTATPAAASRCLAHGDFVVSSL